MGTFVNTSVSGGVDLSSLTSGELLLLSYITSGAHALDNNEAISTSTSTPNIGGYFRHLVAGGATTTTGLDLTAVTSITVRYSVLWRSYTSTGDTIGTVSLRLQVSGYGVESEIYPIPAGTFARLWTNGTLQTMASGEATLDLSFPSSSYGTGLWTESSLYYSFYKNSNYSMPTSGTFTGTLEYVSFTTTDGKVHTSSNLNY